MTFGGLLLGGFFIGTHKDPLYTSLSFDHVKTNQAQVTYYTKSQGNYHSPAFNQVKLKQTKIGPIKIYFYRNKKLVAVRNLHAYDQKRLERISQENYDATENAR